MSELIVRKLRDGRSLTLDERLWAADVLDQVGDIEGLARAVGYPLALGAESDQRSAVDRG